MDKTIKERRARMQERDKARKIVSVRVRTPEGRRDELLALCAQWRQEAALALIRHREVIAGSKERG